MFIEAVDNEIRKGVKITLRFAGRTPGQDEMDDYVQDAWVRFLSSSDEVERENPRLCAKRSAAATIRRYRPMRPLSDSDNQEAEYTTYYRESLSEEIRNELLVEFLHQRKKRGERGLWAASLEVAILNLLWQGYTPKQISNHLEISLEDLRHYRAIIKRRLCVLKGRHEQAINN